MKCVHPISLAWISKMTRGSTKMRGKRGNFGRCDIKGHGHKCDLTQEIQETPYTRGKEKREWNKDTSLVEHMDFMYKVLGEN